MNRKKYNKDNVLHPKSNFLDKWSNGTMCFFLKTS